MVKSTTKRAKKTKAKKGKGRNVPLLPLVLKPGEKLTDEQVYQYIAERAEPYTELYNLLSYQQDVLYAENVTSQNANRFAMGVQNFAARAATYHPQMSRTLTKVCEVLDQSESIRKEALNRIPRSTQSYYMGAADIQRKVIAKNEERVAKLRSLQATAQAEKSLQGTNNPEAVTAGERRRYAESEYEQVDVTTRKTFWTEQMQLREKVKLALQQEVYTRMFYHAKSLELMTEAYKLLDDIPTTPDNSDIKEIMVNLGLNPDGSLSEKPSQPRMAAPQEAAAGAAAVVMGGQPGPMPHQSKPPQNEYAGGLLNQWAS